MAIYRREQLAALPERELLDVLQREGLLSDRARPLVQSGDEFTRGVEQGYYIVALLHRQLGKEG